MSKIDKTYKRAIDTYEMFADRKPSKRQKKQKVKMRQQGKREIKVQIEDATLPGFYTLTPEAEEIFLTNFWDLLQD
jgi:hypothetical protein